MRKGQNFLIYRIKEFFNFLEDLDLLKTTIGVFINMMADDATRMIFKTERGITKLIKLLSQYGEIDWSLSTLICQVIWNYCIDTTNICFIIDEFDVNQLLGLLADYLGKILRLILILYQRFTAL